LAWAVNGKNTKISNFKQYYAVEILAFYLAWWDNGNNIKHNAKETKQIIWSGEKMRQIMGQEIQK
jgi:hypothetical protein